MARCPFCAEQIAAKTGICPHCDADLKNDRLPSNGSSASGSKSLVVFIIGAVCVGGLMLVAVLVALLLPAVQQARSAARVAQCKNQLKGIAIAILNYEEVHRAFPPAYTVDANGQPLHSWRVLILPYMEEKALYDQIDLKEPWNSPKNSRLHDRMPAIYGCPEGNPRELGMTHYLAVVGEQCIMTPTGERGFRDVLDGASNTLMIGESQNPVNWMEPRDIPFENVSTWGDQNGLSGQHRNGRNGHVLMADGFVRTISNEMSIDLKALCTVAGGETVMLGF